MLWRCAVVLAFFGGCVTPLALQPASVVAPGRSRVSLSTAVSPWCGVGTDPRQTCNVFPRGAPLPELRVLARHGLSPGWDLGLSAQGGGVWGVGWLAGAAVDFKRELWSVSTPAEGRRWVVSLAPGVGYSNEWVGSARLGNASLAIPAYVGLQTPHLEWVASLRFVERVAFADLDGDGRREASWDAEGGGAIGVFGRGPVALGVEVGYHTSLARPWGGLLTVAVGAHLELGP